MSRKEEARRQGDEVKEMKKGLSHYGKKGEVRMVDVSAKAVTTRTAVAEGFVKMRPRVVGAVRRLKNPKGRPRALSVRGSRSQE
jgi:molybdenum cofactor biosynthesis enzyme